MGSFKSGINDLQTINASLAKAWWVCSRYGHSWCASIYSRNGKNADVRRVITSDQMNAELLTCFMTVFNPDQADAVLFLKTDDEEYKYTHE